jgi:type IV pilus assembly protein PilE
MHLASLSTRRARGFTLIELMIATAVSAILASIAYPGFQGVVLKARRVDALTSLMQLHMSQERWRSAHARYAAGGELPDATSSSLGHYRLEIAEAGSDGFVAVATATGAQAADRDCRVLQLAVDGVQVRYASGPEASAANAASVNKRCWNL